jgi:hypothetical protein
MISKIRNFSIKGTYYDRLIDLMFKTIAIAALTVASFAQFRNLDISPCGVDRFDNGFNTFDRGVGSFRGINDFSLRNRDRGCFGTVGNNYNIPTPFVGGPAFGERQFC